MNNGGHQALVTGNRLPICGALSLQRDSDIKHLNVASLLKFLPLDIIKAQHGHSIHHAHQRCGVCQNGFTDHHTFCRTVFDLSHQTWCRICDDIILTGIIKYSWVMTNSRFSTNIWLYIGKGRRHAVAHSYYWTGTLIPLGTVRKSPPLADPGPEFGEAHGERAYNGGLGKSSQWSPGALLLVMGSEGEPLDAERFFCICTTWGVGQFVTKYVVCRKKMCRKFGMPWPQPLRIRQWSPPEVLLASGVSVSLAFVLEADIFTRTWLRGDWKRGSGKCDTVKIARVENAGVDNRGGKCRSGKSGSRQQGWKMQE